MSGGGEVNSLTPSLYQLGWLGVGRVWLATRAKTHTDKFHSANLLEDVAVSKIRTLRAFGQSEIKN